MELEQKISAWAGTCSPLAPAALGSRDVLGFKISACYTYIPIIISVVYQTLVQKAGSLKRIVQCS